MFSTRSGSRQSYITKMIEFYPDLKVAWSEARKSLKLQESEFKNEYRTKMKELDDKLYYSFLEEIRKRRLAAGIRPANKKKTEVCI